MESVGVHKLVLDHSRVNVEQNVARDVGRGRTEIVACDRHGRHAYVDEDGLYELVRGPLHILRVIGKGVHFGVHQDAG